MCISLNTPPSLPLKPKVPTSSSPREGERGHAVTWTLPLPWGGLLTLKHPESVSDAEVTERKGHRFREGMMQVHLLLSRSMHGEVRLQQNTHFSTEKDGYSET